MEDATVCGYKLLRELGARRLPSYAALDPKPRRPEDALCVVERFSRDAGAEAAAEFLRDAKRLSQLKHPNLVRVRDVVLGPNVVVLVSDWIDGELLADVQRIAAEQGVPIPLAGSLRIVVDLLEGLSALHEVCDAKRERLQLVHAEVAPRNIVVGIDGHAALVHPLRAPAVLRDGHPDHPPDAVGYLAPEVLLGDQTADQRADVYGAGVLLWEALAGRSMHPKGEDAGEIVMRLLGGKIATLAAPADAPWVAPLVEVAKRAVSPDPSARFANATAMLAEVRRAAGARLAPKLTVSALVEAVAGERIRARAEGFGAKRTHARLPSQSAWTTEAETAAATPRVPGAEALDPEATRRPAPIRSPGTSLADVSPKSATPSPVRPAPPPGAAPRAASPIPAPLRMAPFARPRLAPAASPAAPFAAQATATESESLSIDIDATELESTGSPSMRPNEALAKDGAPPPHVPLLPRPADPSSPSPLGPFRTEMTESKTDMAAAVASISLSAVPSKVRWPIVLACALCFAGVLWMLLRPSGDAAPDSNESPAPSVAGTAAAPPPSASAHPSLAAVEPANAPAVAPDPAGRAGELVAPDPSPEARQAPRPPMPTPAVPPSETSRQESPGATTHQGSVGAPLAAPLAPSPTPPGPPPVSPAASSTHPKKRVYDPMGI